MPRDTMAGERIRAILDDVLGRLAHVPDLAAYSDAATAIRTAAESEHWRAFDAVLMRLNEIDTAGKTGDQVKREIYALVMDMRPALKPAG